MMSIQWNTYLVISLWCKHKYSMICGTQTQTVNLTPGLDPRWVTSSEGLSWQPQRKTFLNAMIIQDCMRKSISLFWNNIYRENMDIGWSSLAIKSRLNQLGSLWYRLHRARLQVTTIPAKSTWLTAHSWLPSRNEEIRRIIYRKLPQSDI